jgi:hypothetical protein
MLSAQTGIVAIVPVIPTHRFPVRYLCETIQPSGNLIGRRAMNVAGQIGLSAESGWNVGSSARSRLRIYRPWI